MKASIRILEDLFHDVHTHVLSSGAQECAAFLTARYFDTGDKTVLLAKTVVPTTPEDYIRQEKYHLNVSPLYVNRVLNVAEREENTIIMVHSHPFDSQRPIYSLTDNLGEELTSETISKCLIDHPVVGSMLFGKSHAIGRMWSGLGKEVASCNVNVLAGASFDVHHYEDAQQTTSRVQVDRQVRALGQRFQAQLENLDVGIVGLGGTGSAVAEQLARMGVGKLRLVDPDTVEPSNLSRLYGSTAQHAKDRAHKVVAVESHLKRIRPDLDIVTIAENVMKNDVLKRLAACDILFSCLDRHAPRAVLNELSYQCFIPIIDVGVGVTRTAGRTVDGAARATIVGPGLPCLLCQDIVRPEAIAAEHLSPEEYDKRRMEGYVHDLQTDAPAVVNYTTIAASFGILLFMDLWSSRRSNTYTTLSMDLNSKEIYRLKSTVKSDCVCQKRLGTGLDLPFSVAD